MTPYKGDSDFAIPREPRALLDALERAQREYENAKTESERAAQAESDAVAARKRLKLTLIDELTADGYAVTRAEKEYVNAPRWQANEEFVLQMQERKRACDVDESIARQRMLTLRAALIPVTLVDDIDAMVASADGDPAHSADVGVAHSA